MRKTASILLIAVCAILVLCAACGGGSKAPVGPIAEVSATMAPTPEPTAEPTPSPEPTATPEPTPTPKPADTPKPAEQPEETKAPEGNSNSNSNSDSNNSQPAPAQEQDKMSIAKSMIGSSPSALFDAIGSPSSSAYNPTCLPIPGADDGTLYYDGFVVQTVRYADGTESIFDVY